MEYVVFSVVNMMVLSKFFNELPFCFKMAAKSRECRLCPISMKFISWGDFVWRTWWYNWKFSLSRHIFQNGCHIARMSTLSDFNENWYLGVIWCAEYDGAIKFVFRATIFFHTVLMMSYCYALLARWAIQAPGSL